MIESEAGDDGAAYGVEIRLDDGSVVEVALDANFHVIATPDPTMTGRGPTTTAARRTRQATTERPDRC